MAPPPAASVAFRAAAVAGAARATTIPATEPTALVRRRRRFLCSPVSCTSNTRASSIRRSTTSPHIRTRASARSIHTIRTRTTTSPCAPCQRNTVSWGSIFFEKYKKCLNYPVWCFNIDRNFLKLFFNNDTMIKKTTQIAQEID